MAMARGKFCKTSYAVTMAKRAVDKSLCCDCNRQWLWEALEGFSNAYPGQLIDWDTAEEFAEYAVRLANE